jgi:ribulose-phosphate 3-epimerase
MIQIAPSILSANPAALGEEVMDVEKAGADLIHFDVMDQHYVPNLTFGPMVCKALKKYTSLPLDVHLMVEPVDLMIQGFAEAGADWISFHPEASRHIDRSIRLIRSFGIKAGLALNPATSIHVLEEVIDQIDFILVMSVNPGFGGQTFIPETIHKIKRIHSWLESIGATHVMIEVDGGIHSKTIAPVVEAGADVVVAGSAVFGQEDRRLAIQDLKAACHASRI